MNPQSEVILRQDRYLSGKILLINPPCDELQDYLQVESVEIWTWNYADFQYFIRDQQTNVHFGIECPQGEFDQAIIFVPKAKELLNYVLEQTAAALGKDKDIFLVGEKKAGIERAAKQLQPYGKVVKLDSARHCQMWQLNNASTVTKQALAAWTKSYRYQLDEIELEICALPGVFSQDHLDTGTQQILPFLAQVRSKKILDFGCGAGIIAATLAIQNNQRQITAVDIDAFALKSTELTFEKNGLSAQLTLQAITDITDLSQRFNAIVSNPPFHQGIKTHYQASENLFKFAAAHLQSKGELWIVANRFLNYAPLIEQQFGHCLIKADQKGFKVLFAKK